VIDGGDGRDFVFGGGGEDMLDGGAGCDILIGGADADTFLFTGGRDMVLDFDPMEDLLQIASDLLPDGQTLTDVIEGARAVCGGTVLDFADNNALMLFGVDDASTLGDSLSLLA